jgi:tetratricopeptide (TPR) repeat protein
MAAAAKSAESEAAKRVLESISPGLARELSRPVHDDSFVDLRLRPSQAEPSAPAVSSVDSSHLMERVFRDAAVSAPRGMLVPVTPLAPQVSASSGASDGSDLREEAARVVRALERAGTSDARHLGGDLMSLMRELSGLHGDASLQSLVEGAMRGDSASLERLVSSTLADPAPVEPALDQTDGYTFTRPADTNPFLGGPAAVLGGLEDSVPPEGLTGVDALHEGRRLFRVGRIPEAILALEAAIRRDSTLSEAWRLLGNAHSENEDDKTAILCLRAAVLHDPYNVGALFDLGCSLVNELKEEEALRVLVEWVRNNPDLMEIDVDSLVEEDDAYSDGSEMSRVTSLMSRVASLRPGDGDVQNVLGLLYNISRHWDDAARAFSEALHSTSCSVPEYVTRNRLGATLANGGRPLEALPSYAEALRLRPTYTRAHFNMGVSLADVGRHLEASKSLVRALQRNPDAPHAWRRLRMELYMADAELTSASDSGETPLSGASTPGKERRDRMLGFAYDYNVDALASELGIPPIETE